MVPRLLCATVLLAAWTGALAETCHYEGSYQNGVPHGYGVCVYVGGGGYYAGQWRNGKEHGHGVMSLVDGTRYEGEWRDGSPVPNPYTVLDEWVAAIIGGVFAAGFVGGIAWWSNRLLRKCWRLLRK